MSAGSSSGDCFRREGPVQGAAVGQGNGRQWDSARGSSGDSARGSSGERDHQDQRERRSQAQPAAESGRQSRSRKQAPKWSVWPSRSITAQRDQAARAPSRHRPSRAGPGWARPGRARLPGAARSSLLLWLVRIHLSLPLHSYLLPPAPASPPPLPPRSYLLP